MSNKKIFFDQKENPIQLGRRVFRHGLVIAQTINGVECYKFESDNYVQVLTKSEYEDILGLMEEKAKVEENAKKKPGRPAKDKTGNKGEDN